MNYVHDNTHHPLSQAYPFFPEQERKWLLKEFDEILQGKLSMGPRVKQFEETFAAWCGTDHAVAFPSCTAALEACLQALGVGPGDEVLVPAQTFIATGMAVHLLGAVPVFTEVSDQDFSMDFEDARKRVTARTKGAIVVHFGGNMSAGLESFIHKMEADGKFVLEDCAHAHGSELKGKKAGTLGKAGCFSFFPTKMMTTGEGGMVTTGDPAFAKICRSIQNRGLDLDNPEESYIRPGRNNRVTEITAAMGLSQLRCLPAYLETRQEAARTYDRLLANNPYFSPMVPAGGVRSSYWKYVVLADREIDRAALKERLSRDRIDVNWAYDPPLHLQPVCVDLFGTGPGSLPRTEALMARHLCLPIHQNLREEDLAFIAERLLHHAGDLAG